MNGRHFKESTDFHERAILSMTAMTRLGEYLWYRPVDSVGGGDRVQDFG